MNAPETTSCTQCGRPFHCGANDEGGCWCATGFAPVLPVPAKGAAGCLCPDCLGRAIERARQRVGEEGR